MIDNVTDNVVDFFESVWAWVKRIVTRILNFFKNIVDWFKDPKRQKRLQEEKGKVEAVVVKHFENGSYNTINCLFNTDTGQIEGEEALGIESEELDATTKKHFGDKDMIVLR
ncbi:hypothetical protein [Helicobacter felis]|uniref:hypothetical protein n=1 Tax=Helicobacter felis TaxID=214 RepID=UPI000CF12709|nr:hypothetical protein [Helicobacter felis]